MSFGEFLVNSIFHRKSLVFTYDIFDDLRKCHTKFVECCRVSKNEFQSYMSYGGFAAAKGRGLEYFDWWNVAFRLTFQIDKD